MKKITNLRLVDRDKLIMDRNDKYYFIISLYFFKTQLCDIKLLELFDDFKTVSMTIPIACNEDYKFISVNDSSFEYELFETDISRNYLTKAIEKSIVDFNKSK